MLARHFEGQNHNICDIAAAFSNEVWFEPITYRTTDYCGTFRTVIVVLCTFISNTLINSVYNLVLVSLHERYLPKFMNQY